MADSALTEAVQAGEFLLSMISRLSLKEVTIQNGEGALVAGTVLGRVTSSGEYAALAPGASDGSQTARAILLYANDSTDAAQPATVVHFAAEVDDGLLNWGTANAGQQTTARLQLLDNSGIQVRERSS